MRASAGLKTYRGKRNFEVTPEPSGGKVEAGHRLIVQHHFARRDHYDLRLEMNGCWRAGR